MKYKIIFLFFFIVWGLMVTRLYQISIKSGSDYQLRAIKNVQKKEYIKPIRGEILDSSGKLLAMNRIGFSISIRPHYKIDSDEFLNVVDELIATFPDLNKTKMLKVYKKSSSQYNHKYIKVVDFVEYQDMIKAYPLLSLNEDILIETETKRYYPYGKFAAHIVGYTGKSNKKENEQDFTVDQVGVIGKTGLENHYNTTLQGELGHVISKVTATNQEVDILDRVDPKENQSIVLNLDMDLQMMIYERMKDISGVVIVMRTNGEILAAVSTPTYDPNMFVGGISTKNWKALQDDPEHPFTNRLIQGTYPPGSTIKMGVAIADALSPRSTIKAAEHCKGWITIGRSGHKFRCWNKHGHGTVDLRKAIRESCDVFFYNKSLRIGIDALSHTLNQLGLGVKTGVDLPREFSGVIPNTDWKMNRFKQQWFQGETVIAAIGQGYDNITPLQLARYTNLLATGYLVTPRFAKIINDTMVAPLMQKVKLNEQLMDTIRLGMYDVCNTPHGTAYAHLKDLPIKVGGKTGTSQVVSIPQNVVNRKDEHDMEYWSRSHALLTTFAPFDNPKYIVTTLVEHGGHGGGTNGPIVADIYKWMYKKGYFNQNPQSNDFSNARDINLTKYIKQQKPKISKHSPKASQNPEDMIKNRRELIKRNQNAYEEKTQSAPNKTQTFKPAREVFQNSQESHSTTKPFTHTEANKETRVTAKNQTTVLEKSKYSNIIDEVKTEESSPKTSTTPTQNIDKHKREISIPPKQQSNTTSKPKPIVDISIENINTKRQETKKIDSNDLTISDILKNRDKETENKEEKKSIFHFNN